MRAKLASVIDGTGRLHRRVLRSADGGTWRRRHARGRYRRQSEPLRMVRGAVRSGS